MRFACDSCGAQYMISDDKVGPGGVKVRCKRCSHVVVVRPAAAPAPVVEPAPDAPLAPPPPSEDASQAAESGLDAELGQAFDHAFGGGQAAAPAPEAPPQEEPAPPPSAPPPEPVPPAGEVEWYVAIADHQVGPLLAAGVKARWEAGEVGPDTLVWKAGMADWAPLSGVQDLAHLVAPLPRPAARLAPRPVEQSPSGGEPSRAPAADAAREPEPGWRPSAASALAKLASEEMDSLAKAEPPPEPAASSLIDKMQLPEGGVDPTGMLPLHLRGVDSTGETLLPRPKAESTEVRLLRKSTNRRLLAAVVAIAAMVGGAVGYVMYAAPAERRTLGSLIAGAPSPPPAPPAPSANPAPAPNPGAAPSPAGSPPPSAGPSVASPEGERSRGAPPAPAVPAPVAAAPAPPSSPPPTAAPAEEAEAKQAKERASRAARKAKPVQREPERKVATATPPPAPDKKPAHDPLLDAVPDDDASKELAGTGKKRSVYVPPAPGSQVREVPERISDPQLIEGIVGKTAALQACVEEQKAAGGDARGPLIMRWTILPDGSVKDPRSLSEGLAKQPIVPCITGVVKSIRFPRSKLGREVEAFPFRF